MILTLNFNESLILELTLNELEPELKEDLALDSSCLDDFFNLTDDPSGCWVEISTALE